MSNFRPGMLAQMRRPWIVAMAILLFIWSLWLLNMSPLPHMVNGTQRHHGGGSQAGLHHEPFAAENTSTKDNTTLNELTLVTNRPLILYAYAETENARINLKFFIAHALHASADFLFVFNGDTDAMDLLPSAPNIRHVHRGNTCYDMGAFAEVLIKDDLYKKYKRFIMMNASIRGPFMPYWSNSCWSDMFLNKVTDSVKLVGMTMNCIPVNHIQSMILATDRIGIETLLFPSDELVKKFRDGFPQRNPAPLIPQLEASLIPALESPGMNSCPKAYWDAVAVEVHVSPLIKAAGYKLDAIMAAFHKSATYEEECAKDSHTPDVLYENTYYGTNLHPFDTIFAKANRKTNEAVLEQLTEWTYGRKYSSYDVC